MEIYHLESGSRMGAYGVYLNYVFGTIIYNIILLYLAFIMHCVCEDEVMTMNKVIYKYQ